MSIKLLILILVLLTFSCAPERRNKIGCKSTIEVLYLDGKKDTLVVGGPQDELVLSTRRGVTCIQQKLGWGNSVACYVKRFKVLSETCQ